MCNIPLPFKIFTIEVHPNDKKVLPAFITPDGMHLTISELKQCRELIDLIINNPNYFHVVKSDQSLSEAIAAGPYCTECGNPQTKEEIGARISLCFDCEKNQILKASDPNRREVGNYAEKIMTDQSQIIVNVKDDVEMPAITQIDDKICDWPGCGKTLVKSQRPKRWEQGHCLWHDAKKGTKQNPTKTQPPTDINTII